MVSQHLPRWCFASITTHFADRVQGVPYYIEGQLKTEQYVDHFEIRMNGPYLTQADKTTWRVDVGVSIFIASAINDTNFHRIHELAGIIVASYTDIGIFKLGPAAELANDQTLIGCLKCGSIQVQHFGQLDPNKDLMRATVDSSYTGLLTLT